LDDRNRLADLARAGIALAFVVLGCLGIVRALVMPAPRALPDRRAASPPDGAVPYTRDRVARLRRELHGAPADPLLQMRLARAFTARAAVRAHQEYNIAFPDAFAFGRYPTDHFETWRRGWNRSDPHGDLRQALRHARRASAPGAPVPLRLQALHLTAFILRQQGRNRNAIAPLRKLLRLAPRDRSAWLYLSEVYRDLGDVSRYRAARRRVEALDVGQAALPMRLQRAVLS
jgi:hypothetical protein